MDDSASFDINCDVFPDFAVKLYKGYTAIDGANSVVLHVLNDSIEIVNDTNGFSVPRYYNIGDTLKCPENFKWASDSIYVLGSVCGWGCWWAPDSINNMYIAYRKANQIGWIKLSFQLEDGGSCSKPCTISISSILVSCNHGISEPFECPHPDSTWTDDVTDTSAMLYWQTSDSALTYTVQYRLTNDSSWTTTTTSLNNHALNNLQDSSEYLWRVSSNCDKDSSSWSDSAFFVTKKSVGSFECLSPDSLAASAITSNTVDLYWNETDSTTSYLISYRVEGESIWFQVSVTSPFYQVTSLQPGTNYEWSVKSICYTDTALSQTIDFFKTNDLDSCHAPEGKQIDTIAPTYATVSWNGVTNAVGYGLRHRIETNPDYSFQYTTNTYALLSGLEPEMEYRLDVISYCSSVDSSNANGEISFVTPGYANLISSFNPILTKIFPNPNSGIFSVSHDRIITEIEIYDITGKTVFIGKPEKNECAINLPLYNGIYLLRIKDVNVSIVQKIMVNR